MGSICHITTNPNLWNAYDSDKKLKAEYGGEHIIHITYGEFDDDPCGTFNLEMYMRESVYNKVMSGEYKVSPDSKWRKQLLLVNRNGAIVPPVISEFCY